MPTEPEPCVLLPWDSAFFGFPVARVTHDCLDSDACLAIDDWCGRQGIRCLYFSARSDCPVTRSAAETAGFRLVDVRITLARPVGQPDAAATGDWRTAERADVDKLRGIAAQSHADSRFFFDGNFGEESCQRLYATWIQVSCEGWADRVITTGPVGDPAGYVTCHCDRPALGRVGLLGIDAEQRGRGLGQALAHAAIAWFAEQGMTSISVVTQGRNVAAQRLYQRCGFVTDRVEMTYHKWYPEKRAR